MFKGLLNKKLLLSGIAIALVLIGSSMKIPLPFMIVKLFKLDIIKVILLVAVLYVGRISIQYALITGLLYIVLNDKLNDTEIENFSSKL